MGFGFFLMEYLSLAPRKGTHRVLARAMWTAVLTLRGTPANVRVASCAIIGGCLPPVGIVSILYRQCTSESSSPTLQTLGLFVSGKLPNVCASFQPPARTGQITTVVPPEFLRRYWKGACVKIPHTVKCLPCVVVHHVS